MTENAIVVTDIAIFEDSRSPGLMLCLVSLVMIWSIIVEEQFVTLVALVISGIAPLLTNVYKNFLDTAEVWFWVYLC